MKKNKRPKEKAKQRSFRHLHIPGEERSKGNLRVMDYSNPRDREDFYTGLFLTAGNVLKNCIILRIDRAALYKALGRDAEFRKEFEVIRSDALEGCVDELIHRGYEGVLKSVRGPSGKVVGYERVYSDQCLIALLRGLKREFKTDIHQIGGFGGPIGIEDKTVRRFSDLLLTNPEADKMAHGLLELLADKETIEEGTESEPELPSFEDRKGLEKNHRIHITQNNREKEDES